MYQLKYLQGSRSAADLASLLEDLTAQISTDGELRGEAARYGVTASDITTDSIKVQQGAAGIDPGTITLTVTFMTVPFLDLWKYVLLPRIRKRWGADSVGPEAK